MNEENDLEEEGEEDVCDEAKRLTSNDRQEEYGPADESFKRIATVWSALLGTSITPTQVAVMMVAFKCCRAMGGAGKRDNFTDMIGYARLGWACCKIAFKKRKAKKHKQSIQWIKKKQK